MSKERCFRLLPMVSGAAIMGVLQAVVVVLLLSTTGVLLNRWNIWRSQYETYSAADTSETTTAATTTPPGFVAVSPLTTTTEIVHQAAFAVWPENGTFYRDSSLSAFLEIHLTQHVALYCLWLICLVFFALAFRYRKPALVLPNLVMQAIGLLLIMILAGIVIAKLVLLSKEYDSIVTPTRDYAGHYPRNWQWQRDDINVRYAFYAILLGVLAITWVAELVFIWIAVDFYNYLRDHQRVVYPGEPEPRTSYHHHQDHAILHDERDPKRHYDTHVVTTTTPTTTRVYP